MSAYEYKMKRIVPQMRTRTKMMGTSVNFLSAFKAMSADLSDRNCLLWRNTWKITERSVWKCNHKIPITKVCFNINPHDCRPTFSMTYCILLFSSCPSTLMHAITYVMEVCCGVEIEKYGCKFLVLTKFCLQDNTVKPLLEPTLASSQLLSYDQHHENLIELSLIPRNFKSSRKWPLQ